MVDEAYLEAAQLVARIVGRRYAFGYFSAEDIRQEAVVFALEAYAKYDRTRPPRPFIYHHVKNRLRNLYRDKCHRNDPPCRACHEGRSADAHASGRPCGRYLTWRALNRRKADVLSPAGFEEAPAESEDALLRPDTAADDAALAELRSKIDRELPASLRADYLRLIGGASLRPCRRRKVEAAVRAILGGL